MMTHIMERYFTNTTHVDLTDRLCEAALRSIIANGEKTLKEPENYDTRAEIVWAGTLAHNGLLNTGRVQDWASHRIALEMSGLYDIAHGASSFYCISCHGWNMFTVMIKNALCSLQ